MTRRRRLAGRVPPPPVLVSVALAALGGACAGGSSAGSIVVSYAWTRPTPTGATDAAIYLEIDNGTDVADRLLGAQSDRCMAVQVHATSIDADGVSRMAEAGAEATRIEPGQLLVLAPNGLHLMCSGLSTPLAPGDEFVVQVELEVAGRVEVAVAVDDR